MLPFFLRELQEYALPLGILEPRAVAPEEPVRSPLAANADPERLTVVHSGVQLVGPCGEEAVGGSLEEKKGRPPLKARFLLQQLGVALLKRTEMFPFFLRQLEKDFPPALILGQSCGAGVELETAPLGRDRDAKRVPREKQLRRYRLARLLAPLSARFARTVDLHYALFGREAAIVGNLFDQRFDI